MRLNEGPYGSKQVPRQSKILGMLFWRPLQRAVWADHGGLNGVSTYLLRCFRNACNRPVLKHGPRSLTSMRVFEWKTLTRNESDRWDTDPPGKVAPSADLEIYG